MPEALQTKVLVPVPVTVEGHIMIVELETGQVLLDQHNAVHSQNISRVIARSLSNENNYYIHRIAFGNGGTFIDPAFTITYNTVNDGQAPDPNTWQSRLYQETYSEIIDEGNPSLNPLLGTDPGSADASGIRPGGGAVPANDPISIPHVSGPGVRSNELGLTSEVVVSVVLNPSEPTGQFDNDNQAPTEDPEGSFTFDELGLYTSGAPAVPTSGSHDIDVGNRTAFDDSGLLPGTSYDFRAAVDGGGPVTITITTPVTGGSGTGGEILYGDIVKAILTGSVAYGLSGVNPLPGGATVNITNDGTFDGAVPAAQTYGFLRFQSITTGIASSVTISNVTVVTPALDLIPSLNPPTGGIFKTPVNGAAAGIQNDPLNPANERERLLTHIIFSPVLKAANRTLSITYTLTISVARTP